MMTPENTTLSQLALGVRLRDEATFDNFLGARNRLAVGQVQALLASPACPVVYVCGATGTGKSHVLQAACHASEANGVHALCLSMTELVDHAPDMLDGLERFPLVCMDDLDCIQHRPAWQEAVFHIYNRLLDNGCRLLLSATLTPTELALPLRDLDSRLRAAAVVQLLPPRDEDRLAILVARAERRGLVMNDEVAHYILRRASRHTGDLLGILDRLDDISLRAQRKLTVPFVKGVMGW